jgi:hypothetical protein
MPKFPSAPKLSIVAFLAAACLAAGCLLVFGTDTKAIRRTLAVTARFSYIWFWLTYAGGAIAFFVPWFRRVARHGREFGLAFVSSHSIHLLLVIWLYQISPEPPIALNGAVFFGIGVGFMYLLAFLSIKRFARMLDPWLWRATLLIGIEYIEYAFLTDFWVNPLHPMSMKQFVAYLPFMLIGLLATTMRLLRWSVQAATRIASA